MRWLTSQGEVANQFSLCFGGIDGGGKLLLGDVHVKGGGETVRRMAWWMTECALTGPHEAEYRSEGVYVSYLLIPFLCCSTGSAALIAPPQVVVPYLPAGIYPHYYRVALNGIYFNGEKVTSCEGSTPLKI